MKKEEEEIHNGENATEETRSESKKLETYSICRSTVAQSSFIITDTGIQSGNMTQG